MEAAVDALLADELLNPILDALRGPALEAADFLLDVRDIEPGDDLASAVLDLFLDRIEDAITDAFGRSSPRIPIAIKFKARATQQTIFGPVSLLFDVDFNLGSIRIPLGDVLDAVRGAARSIDAVVNTSEAVASKLAAAIAAERALAATQTEYAVIEATKAEIDAALAETRPAAIDAIIVSPGESSIVEGSFLLDIHLPGVPRSYLGLKPEEAERVHVWLNRTLISNDSFVVRSLGDDAATEVAKGRIPSSTTSKDHDLTAFPRQHGVSLARTAHPLLEVRGAVRKSSGRVGKTSSIVRQGIVQPVGLIGRVPEGLRLGRAVRESDRMNAEASAAPGLGLQLRLFPDQVQEGINTLVVSVVDGRGRHRVERQVTFVALPPNKRPKLPPSVRSGKKVQAPADVSFSLDALPPSIRERLATSIGRPDLAPQSAKAVVPGKATFKAAGALGPWISAPKAQRAKEVTAGRARTLEALRASRKPLQTLRKFVVEGTLPGAKPREAK